MGKSVFHQVLIKNLIIGKQEDAKSSITLISDAILESCTSDIDCHSNDSCICDSLHSVSTCDRKGSTTPAQGRYLMSVTEKGFNGTLFPEIV